LAGQKRIPSGTVFKDVGYNLERRAGQLCYIFKQRRS
jgi:hypothetical protein